MTDIDWDENAHLSDDGGREPGGRTGWSNGGTLITKNADKKVSLQAVFPAAGTYTVAVSLERAVGSADPPRAIAIIDWAVAGNTVRRVISVISGASISGVGEGVQVTVVDDSENGGVGGSEYNVTCTVAKGVRSGALPVTREPPMDSVAFTTGTQSVYNSSVVLGPGQYVQWAVPQDEGIVGFQAFVGGLNGAPAAELLLLSQQTSGGAAIAQCDARDSSSYMMFGSTVYVQLENKSAVNVRAQILYHIDG